MAGIATGIGLCGRPIFAYSIGNFTTMRCLEQIRNDAAYHEVNVNFVASGGGFSYGQLGMSHHATEDLAIMRALPGVQSFAPCTTLEASRLTGHIARTAGVSYLRLDKSWAPDTGEDFEVGKLRCFCEGEKVAIIATGGILSEALSAKKLLSTSGIEPAVYGCHSLKPIDKDSLGKIAQKYEILVSVEEHNLIGGLASAISETLLEIGIYPKKFIKIGLEDLYSSVVGDQKFLRCYYGMDAKTISSKICHYFIGKE